jgi:hypothetical protein
VDGASKGTTNVIVPLSVPLLVTPLLYILDNPILDSVFIQNGCPLALIINV